MEGGRVDEEVALVPNVICSHHGRIGKREEQVGCGRRYLRMAAPATPSYP